MEEIDDLDLVLLSPAAWRAWAYGVAPRAAEVAAALGLQPDQIPIERGRVEEDGSLTIYVVFPNGIEVNMSVPPDQWAWKQAH